LTNADRCAQLPSGADEFGRYFRIVRGDTRSTRTVRRHLSDQSATQSVKQFQRESSPEVLMCQLGRRGSTFAVLLMESTVDFALELVIVMLRNRDEHRMR
jgi:hypothetical protein